MRKTTWQCLLISMSLLLILLQMSSSLVVFSGVFIHSDEVLISPFTCPERYNVYGADCGITTDIIIITLGLYVPLVLVAFALLSMLFAAYARDGAAMGLSMALQAASSLLIHAGIIGFLVLYQSYVTWEHMTLSFYLCVGVQVQLVITTVLTWMTRRHLKPDWE